MLTPGCGQQIFDSHPYFYSLNRYFIHPYFYRHPSKCRSGRRCIRLREHTPAAGGGRGRVLWSISFTPPPKHMRLRVAYPALYLSIKLALGVRNAESKYSKSALYPPIKMSGPLINTCAGCAPHIQLCMMGTYGWICGCAPRIRRRNPAVRNPEPGCAQHIQRGAADAAEGAPRLVDGPGPGPASHLRLEPHHLRHQVPSV